MPSILTLQPITNPQDTNNFTTSPKCLQVKQLTIRHCNNNFEILHNGIVIQIHNQDQIIVDKQNYIIYLEDNLCEESPPQCPTISTQVTTLTNNNYTFNSDSCAQNDPLGFLKLPSPATNHLANQIPARIYPQNHIQSTSPIINNEKTKPNTFLNKLGLKKIY